MSSNQDHEQTFKLLEFQLADSASTVRQALYHTQENSIESLLDQTINSEELHLQFVYATVPPPMDDDDEAADPSESLKKKLQLPGIYYDFAELFPLRPEQEKIASNKQNSILSNLNKSAHVIDESDPNSKIQARKASETIQGVVHHLKTNGSVPYNLIQQLGGIESNLLEFTVSNHLETLCKLTPHQWTVLTQEANSPGLSDTVINMLPSIVTEYAKQNQNTGNRLSEDMVGFIHTLYCSSTLNKLNPQDFRNLLSRLKLPEADFRVGLLVEQELAQNYAKGRRDDN